MPTRKIRKRKDVVEFHETLTPVVPYAPAAPTIPAVRAGISDRYLRAGLYLVWAVAAILAGISVGLWTNGKLRAPRAEAPVPVAKSAVKVATVAGPALVSGAVAQTKALGTAPATGTGQAQAPAIVPLVSGEVLQPTAGPDALQPGFSHYGHTQGNRGTAPVGQ